MQTISQADILVNLLAARLWSTPLPAVANNPEIDHDNVGRMAKEVAKF